MIKKGIIISFTLTLCVVCILSMTVLLKEKPTDKPKEILEQVGAALGDEYEKQTVTELAATRKYVDNEGNKIIYYTLVTSYYEACPSEATELNENALQLIFSPVCAKEYRNMTIQEWPAALYVLPDRSYLCIAYSAEITLILEYDPAVVSDEDIIKMAESFQVVKEQ